MNREVFFQLYLSDKNVMLNDAFTKIVVLINFYNPAVRNHEIKMVLFNRNLFEKVLVILYFLD